MTGLNMDVKRREFYEGYRREFENRLTQGQVNGFEATFDYYVANFNRGWTLTSLPYVLATFYHETGRTMQPVREGFAKSNEEAVRIVTRMYEQGRISINYAKPDPVTGLSYYGRGMIQTTWEDNYRKLGFVIFNDRELLVNSPDLLLDLKISVETSIEGMKLGLFTGKRLSDYLTKEKKDYYNARRIVNGLDRASLIAGYAERFEKIIQLT